MKQATVLTLGALVAIALGSTACRDSTPTPTTTTTGASPTADAAVVMPYATTTPTPVTMPKTTPTTDSTLTDAQILQITHTANDGEIAQAKLALQKTKDDRVKKLAQMMLDEHTDADKKGADLVKKEGLTMADSNTAGTLKTDGDKTTDDLRSKSATDFDKAYVDAQVKEHQTVLTTIDGPLLSNAKDSDVKGYLNTIRPKIAEHLKHAQKLQSDLAK